MSRWMWTAFAMLPASGQARAEDGAAWLERFDVVSGCPDRAVFRDAVGRRVARSLDAAFEGLRLGISIERSGSRGSDGLIGKLQVTDASGVASTRELAASSCPQLLEALSLLAAVTADAARSSDAPLSTSSTSPGVDPDAMELRAAGKPRDVAPAPRAIRENLRIGPALYVLLQDASTPDPELGFGLALSLTWPAPGYWAPWLQVGGYRVQSGELPIGDGRIRARFELFAAHAVACPLRFPAQNLWSVRPCVELEIGRLGGEGRGAALEQVTDRDGLWASSALSLRGEVSPWAPLTIGASLGAVLPWTRHEFFFAPDMLAFSVPRLGFRGTLAGALMF